MAVNSTIPTMVETARPEAADVPRSGWSARIRWAQRGGLAALDQAFFAGTHFVVNVLLARWLPAADYGAFAVAYSAYLLLDSAYHALVSEPMLAFGAAQTQAEFRRYLGAALRLHFIFTFAGSGAILIASALIAQWQPTTAKLLAGMAFAAPFLLLLWLSRRAKYVRLRAGAACLASGLYLVLVTASVVWLAVTGLLSAFRVLLSMGAAAGVVSMALLWSLRPALRRKGEAVLIKEIARRHWSYGRWILGSMVFASVTLNCYYFLLPIEWGLEASAGFRAVMNLTNPGIHLLIGLTSLLIPAFAVASKERGVREVSAAVRHALAVLIPVSLAFIVALWLVRFKLIDFLYAGAYRDHASWSLLLVALALVPLTISTIFGCALRGVERTRDVFFAFFMGAVAALVSGVPLTARYGVIGASSGLLISQVVTSGYLWMSYRNWAAKRGAHA